MKIIADSSTTRTEWVLVDGDHVVERAFTTGMNPFFQSRREISHCIRLELPDSFFRRRCDHVYFRDLRADLNSGSQGRFHDR